MRGQPGALCVERTLLAAIHRWATYGVPWSPGVPTAPSRPGLRNSVGADGPPGDRQGRVLRIDPSDGATGVFIDDPVVATLSHAVDATTATGKTVRVADDAADVPGQLHFSPNARVLVWTPLRALRPGVRHTVILAGLRDLRGREIAPHVSGFVPCPFSAGDVMN